ncbi:MAG: hypothetical protein ACJAU0_002559 [Flavobacteriales bacterium]|jgi:hypothetical protein
MVNELYIMIAAITHLRLKNVSKIPLFFKLANASGASASIATGNVHSSVRNKGMLIFRTLTVWKDMEALLNYVHSSPHLEAMKATKNLSNDAYTTHWETSNIPSWEEALIKLEQASN